MLYKNDDPYKMDKNELAEVRKFFHNKFPVKVVYPPERITKSRLPHNRLPDKPNSISFDLKSTVRTLDGAAVWRYADDMIFDAKGKKKYIPKKFRFNGGRYLDEKDIELIFFLLKKSEVRYLNEDELKADKKLKQPRQPKFMFEDLVTEADKKAEGKALESKITVLLYNKELGLPEERIRLVAKAYHIKGVDELTFSQVRILLDNKIHDKKLGGPDKFFEMVNADEELEARASLQKAIDLNYLKYDMAKNTWFWNTDGENGKSIICKVSRNDIPVENLFNMYRGDENFREDIKALVLTKGKKPEKKKEKETEDDE
jgi:hypothetical protein